MKPKKDLTVLPVKKPVDNNAYNLHKDLPSVPNLGVIIAPVKSGKSNLIMNLLLNDNFYKNVYNNIYYISPTVNYDKTLTALKDFDDIIKVDQNLQHLNTIISNIIELCEQNENITKDDKEVKRETLIVLDDCLGFFKNGDKLSFLCSRFRHYNISIWITSQSYRSVPLVCRNNATFFILFRSTSAKEIKKITEEFGQNFTDNFENWYEQATKEKYNFLYCDMTNMKLFHNFKELLYEKN